MSAPFLSELWNLPIYAELLQEVDPESSEGLFRLPNVGYSGDQSFWSIPSPEPTLPPSITEKLSCSLPSDSPIKQAAKQLASQIAHHHRPDNLLFIAILRAGIPIAKWLTQLLPGAVAVGTSLFVGYGFDELAYQTIRADYPDRQVIFVDGWSGKGGVSREIAQANRGPLAVLVDPWCVANYRGTTSDLLLPSACFTGPATLGFSRTFVRDNQSMFGAYRFSRMYLLPSLVEAWIASCEPQPIPLIPPVNTPPTRIATDLRLHSNEVCRAFINSMPGHLYFATDQATAIKDYELLLELAEHRKIPVTFAADFLRKLNALVGCTLNLKSQ